MAPTTVQRDWDPVEICVCVLMSMSLSVHPKFVAHVETFVTDKISLVYLKRKT
jgi:hypothetical protein